MSVINNKEIIDPYGFIYITTNMINGKKYIGQKMFRVSWQNYLGSGTYFLRSVKNYGKENFHREIIAIAYSKEELNELEIEFIKLHNAVKSKDYYNISYGGEASMSGLSMSEEAKRKISEARKRENLSDETRKKMSNAHKGKKVSDSHKQILLIQSKPKLNNEQAKEIREKYATGNYTHEKLAKEYGVKHTTIGRVINYEGVYKY